MKIILEFDHTEAREAEQAYKGPQYAMALETFAAYMRTKRKYGNHGEEAQKAVEDIERAMYESFDGLMP
jgi:hypothetical protein